MEFLLRLVDTLPVLAVDDEDETLCAGIVVSPQGSNLVLSSNVPNVELDILVGYCLNIEADWIGGKVFSNWQCVVEMPASTPVGMVVTDWLSLSL